eukprot:CAMPEP_0172457598 /NCGR_PEP_ID=MMETSP1065-20121228/23003_1 /TAXON_ID=265537 /ORGANISM="Amphiprora paludosa, Strain CCMP125" /LENGTH=100 /DNA_ID=CAMNT_0013211427 /DNA_START=23 /DNA_END=325 /DNA_ORIENTATION=+
MGSDSGAKMPKSPKGGDSGKRELMMGGDSPAKTPKSPKTGKRELMMGDAAKMPKSPKSVSPPSGGKRRALIVDQEQHNLEQELLDLMEQEADRIVHKLRA